MGQWLLEASMAAVADRVLSISRPATISSDVVWIPLVGGLWVATNVILVGMGICINWPVTCAFLAGLINGTLLSVIAVATASERFQAGGDHRTAGRTQPECSAQRRQHGVESHAGLAWLC